MILSLQGCMAVGKTTAAHFIQENLPGVQVFFEDNTAVLAEIRRRGLNRDRYEDYLEIQRLFLQNELARGRAAQQHPVSVMDFGAEEIVFYTLCYPRSKGLDWDTEAIRQALAPELAAVQAYWPEHILFLDAPDAVLRARKEGDAARSRGFFSHYCTHLLPLKREWFRNRENVTVLQTEGLTAVQAGEQAARWCAGRAGIARE